MFVGSTAEETVVQNAYALGGVKVLRELIDLKYEDIYPEEGE